MPCNCSSQLFSLRFFTESYYLIMDFIDVPSEHIVTAGSIIAKFATFVFDLTMFEANMSFYLFMDFIDVPSEHAIMASSIIAKFAIFVSPDLTMTKASMFTQTRLIGSGKSTFFTHKVPNLFMNGFYVLHKISFRSYVITLRARERI